MIMILFVQSIRYRPNGIGNQATHLFQYVTQVMTEKNEVERDTTTPSPLNGLGET